MSGIQHAVQPGKMRGLQTTANQHGIFTILAIDHGASLQRTIRPQKPESVDYHEMVAVKEAVLRHLAPHASAVLVDPVYGLASAVLAGNLSGRTGLLVAVEDGDYASPRSPARNFDGWNVAKIKRSGCSAVKCFFYYHPDDTALAQQQESFVAALVEECRRYDLPLFAEPLSYDVEAAERQPVIVETARRISRLGVDVLKVEFPINVHQESDESVWADACRALSEVCTVPWALLSAGVDFEMFARQVQIACQAGASGYLVGRAVWKEAVLLSSEERAAYLQAEGVPRLQRLSDIANMHGRPWTDFYPYQTAPSPEGWYKAYSEV